MTRDSQVFNHLATSQTVACQVELVLYFRIVDFKILWESYFRCIDKLHVTGSRDNQLDGYRIVGLQILGTDGRTDGEFNETPDFQDAIMYINWAGDSLTVKNGAYVKVNAANEVAVDAFINKKIGFMGIPELVGKVLDSDWTFEPKTFHDVFEADSKARKLSQELL